jgi:hypothetical protein
MRQQAANIPQGNLASIGNIYQGSSPEKSAVKQNYHSVTVAGTDVVPKGMNDQ